MIRKLVTTTIAIVCLLSAPVLANQKNNLSGVKTTQTKVTKSAEKSTAKVNSTVNKNSTAVKSKVTAKKNQVKSIKKAAKRPRLSSSTAKVDIKQTIVRHSLALGIDPALGLSIAKSESGFRHESRSSNGAVGVFQLMPSTARRMGLNPYYVSDNIKAGLMYYKRMYDMFGSTELALAAYNAGPAAVKKHHCAPSYTRGYVSRIMAEYHRQKINPDSAIKKSNANYSKNMKNVTSRHKTVKKLSSSSFEHRLIMENSLLNKTIAEKQNVKFVLVKKI